MRSIRFS